MPHEKKDYVVSITRNLLISLILLLPLFSWADVLTSSVSNDIYEPPEIYDKSSPSLLNIHVKTHIEAGACNPDDYTGCTLKDVLNDINRSDKFKPEVKISFEADDYDNNKATPNATLRQRGGFSSRHAPIKSFRIKLNKKAPLWRGQRRIQLVKAFSDLSRIRNKLSFDLFSKIPHLPSLRTQFVRLYINDNNVELKQGLYTHIEHVGKNYLKIRNWNKKSTLYKAEYFYFNNDPGLAIDSKGEPINEKKFEKILEIKSGKNNKALINMLNALEDESLDFSTQILDTYFDRDNLLTWLAINILTNNIDTKIHNYYLYNPYSSQKFYFIPWDYDRAWGLAQEQDENTIKQLPNWWFSHANWWENKLFKRFLSTSNNLELLQKTVKELKNKYLSHQKIQMRIDSYRNVVFPVIREDTDWNTIELRGETDPERIAEYNRILQLISNNVEFNYAKFLEHLKDPMPFRLHDPVVTPDNFEVTFTWTESTSLFKQQIVYDLEISNNPEFMDKSIIEKIKNISKTSYSLLWKHPKGNYYYRIISRDANAPDKYWQTAWNRTIKLNNGLQAYGVKSFTVTIGEEQQKHRSGGSASWSLLFLLLLLTTRKILSTNKYFFNYTCKNNLIALNRV